MLSQNERRQLEAIEQELAAEDPWLAKTLQFGQFKRHKWLLTAVWVFGLACFALGCVTGSVTLALAGAAFALAGLGLAYRNWRRRKNKETN